MLGQAVLDRLTKPGTALPALSKLVSAASLYYYSARAAGILIPTAPVERWQSG
jgi:hypothetical protein